MKKLETFSLINNNLSALSREMTEMTNIKYLKIEGQNISQLPQGMENLV
jgi:Leucine-rich repeat (LRR) protein